MSDKLIYLPVSKRRKRTDGHVLYWVTVVPYGRKKIPIPLPKFSHHLGCVQITTISSSIEDRGGEGYHLPASLHIKNDFALLMS